MRALLDVLPVRPVEQPDGPRQLAPVPTKTIHELVAKHPALTRTGFLKVDIEGAEADVIVLEYIEGRTLADA